MMMRGIGKQNSIMQTSMMLGTFRSNEKTRLEFLALVKG
jgi:GTP cyclohydrolase I